MLNKMLINKRKVHKIHLSLSYYLYVFSATDYFLTDLLDDVCNLSDINFTCVLPNLYDVEATLQVRQFNGF